MDLLTAVNRLITSTGESPIEALDDTHPLQQAALLALDQSNKRLQSRGWWFNTFLRTVTGTAVPADVVFAVPVNRSLDLVLINSQLIDNNGVAYTGDLECAVRTFVPTTVLDWAKLPESFADYACAEASGSFAKNYDVDAQKLQILATELISARSMCNMEQVRYARLNLFTAGSTGVNISRSWSSRQYRC